MNEAEATDGLSVRLTGSITSVLFGDWQTENFIEPNQFSGQQVGRTWQAYTGLAKPLIP